MTQQQKLERILKGLQQDLETASLFNDQDMIAHYDGLIASVTMLLNR